MKNEENTNILKTTRKVNYKLYLFELVFAFLVVFVHMPFETNNIYLDSLGRTTVLFFFMFSSYFYCQKLDSSEYTYKDTLKRCLRLLIIYISVFLVYFILYLPLRFHQYGLLDLSEGININTIYYFFNFYSPHIGFLWFISALIFCYLLFPLIYKIKWLYQKKWSIIIPILILVLAYIYRIINSYFFIDTVNIVETTRNFLITGIPCFLIGSYIKHHKDNLIKIDVPTFIIITLLSIITLSIETHLYSIASNEFYLSSLLMAIITLIFCSQNNESEFGEKLYSLFGKSGPLIIYIGHTIILDYLKEFLTFKYADILIVAISIFICLIFAFTYNLIKIYILRKKKIS